ncbi:MAG: ATP-dependent Clp protease ATP-binding subunit ClpC, partial [Verrucomicrobiales bacterium]
MRYQLTIPVYTERQSQTGGSPEYVATPVFVSGYERADQRESRALSQLETDLRKTLTENGADPKHRLPNSWSFAPELTGEKVRLRIQLRKQYAEAPYFIVRFRSFDRWLCFCPKLPKVNFELMRGQRLQDRANQVYSEHFRKLERAGDDFDIHEHATTGTARLSALDIECLRNQAIPKPRENRFSSIGGSGEMSGNAELERVGRNLNRLYPDSLERAILREEEVQLLYETLTDKKRLRPVLLVGPSQVGKTAIVHEFLHRYLNRQDQPDTEETTTRKKKRKSRGIRALWLLDPQRLISGMAYVGQWEERFLAIVKEMRKRRHVMYIDDLVGFFQAGRTRDSNLSLGDLLKAQYEESPLKLLAETTPEGWRKLREIDRGFADLFRVIRIAEPSEADTIRIAIHTMNQLEDRTGVQFKPDVLPLTIELQRRFMRARSFPGKAVEFLRQLSSNFPKRSVDAALAREHFQRKTGMATVFLETGSMLQRADIDRFFNNRIVGQEAALGAMADVISLGKGRLNDPDRPLASLLFLGPTGVGKTECAKALAEYFFGSSERLLRFDMNEFVGADAAARLIGHRGQSRGLLTSALRRQPFTVLLLDEVEKAHPEVFDLLLQVLGEGRLTDAGGRTADFCNAVIVLTSNLGAREGRKQVGFGASSTGDAATFVGAAEKFFRPEFFNRLDRVIPFHALTREHITGMAEQIARRGLDRFGLRQRKLMLEIHPDIFRMLAERGFDTESGARSLRRAVEDHLVQPLAEILSKQSSEKLTSIELALDADGKLTATGSSFVAAAPVARRRSLPAREIKALSDRLDVFLKRVGNELDDWGDDGDDYAVRAHYFFLREELLELRPWRDQLLANAAFELNPQNTNVQQRASRFGKQSTRLIVRDLDPETILEELNNSADAGKMLAKMAATAEVIPTLSHHAENLIQRANKLQFFLSHKDDPDLPVKMYFRGNHPHRSSSSSKQSYHARINDIVTSYISCFDQEA